MTEGDPPRKPPTIEDVARHIGLSRQTISRVVNNKGKLRDSTRERVLSAIQELGYRPNSLARGLVTSKSQVVALIVPDITQPFYPQIAKGVEDGAYEAGYSVFLSHTAGNVDREINALERLQGHRVDGVIICNPRVDDAALDQAINNAFPVVLVNRKLPGVRGTVIWPGYDSGSALATEHLLQLGLRDLIYIGLERGHQVQSEKIRGYREQLERYNVPFDSGRVLAAVESFQGGYEAMRAFLERGDAVDGVVAFNDSIAIGAMRAALDAGRRIPEDLAIIGFGGSEVSAMVSPSLSTIDVPLYSIGRTAVMELLNLIAGTEEQHGEVHISPKLQVRESTTKKT
jgi:LacI family transcriptional regulator